MADQSDSVGGLGYRVVFVLSAGRAGSNTFAQACQHITNYTAGHESRVGMVADDKLSYPERHIEADNRLVWLLGRIEQQYGDEAYYVYLRRDIKRI